jgi:hypothetical protein
MPLLHDPACKAEITRRVAALRPDSRRRWGKMSVSQMLWHVNEAMETALGRRSLEPQRMPLPRPVMKFIVVNLPWPKGATTLKPWLATRDDYDFSEEHDRCLRLIRDLAERPLDGPWPESPSLGRMSGAEVSRLQAKHLNHHLTQFGV